MHIVHDVWCQKSEMVFVFIFILFGAIIWEQTI